MNRHDNQHGVTLAEVIVVLAILGIMLGISTMGVEFYQAHQVRSASRQLLGAIERVRQDALTKRTTVPPPGVVVSRGFGLRLTANGYVTFEFNDLDNDGSYDDGAEERAPVNGPSFPTSIRVAVVIPPDAAVIPSIGNILYVRQSGVGPADRRGSGNADLHDQA